MVENFALQMFLCFMKISIKGNLKHQNDKYFIQDLENINKNLLCTITVNCIYERQNQWTIFYLI